MKLPTHARTWLMIAESAHAAWSLLAEHAVKHDRELGTLMRSAADALETVAKKIRARLELP